MPQIEVETLTDKSFRVRVTDSGAGASFHHVTVTPTCYQRLTGGKITPAELVRRSFEFLLQHEPKESILAEFDLQVIERYFPQYPRAMKSQMDNAEAK